MIKKIFKKIIQITLILATLVTIGVYMINSLVVDSTQDRVFTQDILTADQNCDAILVLGCGVHSDGTPSPMLEDRLNMAIELYKKGYAPKLLMSGDHSKKNYDEVGVMKKYAMDNGVPSEDIFTDHAGFSTYESMYRAKEVFIADNIIVVTQNYHIYRALYIANSLGITAVGVNSDQHKYVGHQYFELREMLARSKDFVSCLIKVKPTYLGDAIPVSGDGNLSNG